MSPPEVWGPAVWTLFHTLAEKLNSNAYNQVIPSLFATIVQICKVLPCPECSKDASNFLAKIKLTDYKNKDDFKNMLYLFHNFVNAKKRKPLYNYAYMNKYSNINLIFVVNDFIAKYNTKGNMKLLTESFQRSFVIKNFINWFNAYKLAFIQPVIINTPEKQITENLQTIKETIVEETVVEETVVEETVVEDTLVEEKVFEEKVVEETVVEESVVEETVFEETYNNNNNDVKVDIKNYSIYTEDSGSKFENIKNKSNSKKGRKSKIKNNLH